MKNCLYLIVFSLLFYAGLTSSAVSDAHLKGQVHFEPFEYSLPEKNDYVYFTLFIVPNRQSNLLDLCKMEPRIRDVVNSTLQGQKNLDKMGLKNRHMKNASNILRQRINKALGVDWVYEAIFLRGAIDVETGPVENPTIPKPLSCKQIYFRAKSSRDPDAH